MQEFLQIYLSLSGVVFLYMVVWYIVALVLRRNDVADVAWWLGFLLVAWYSLFLQGFTSPAGFLSTFLVSIWWLRLSTHIFLRNIHKTEDYRYKNWRDSWGEWFLIRSFLQIFVLQGILLLLISLPVVVTIFYVPVSVFAYIWCLLWCVWFFFETVGDYQLSQFRKNLLNKGKIIQSGLWSLSRHPNYFGEVLQWWALWVFTLPSPYYFIAVLGPVTITVLILFVSGIPLLEKKMLLHPDFAEYQRNTHKFFPWFSKRFVFLQRKPK
jgi:steroid 5-alpha reductase family enzyme